MMERTATEIQEEGSSSEGAVIVTKVLWQNDLPVLKEWICYINHAYNDKASRDVVVFTTLPWDDHHIAQLQAAAAPSNLAVALEGPSLEEQLAAMTKDELKFLRNRCGIQDDNNNETLTYFHHCREPNYSHVNNLGYAWQAEFRAYHIWTHPAIRTYKYMMWVDADAKLGTHWDVDPIQIMMDRNLTAMYAQFPYGTVANNQELGQKLTAAYGTSICNVEPYNDNKHIYAKVCKDQPATINQIAGMHHITNLDVYRKDIHQTFLKNFTGDYRFSRRNDDQMAVTIVATMEQYMRNNYSSAVPEKALVWHERSNGMTFKIAHHGKFDGVEFAPKNRSVFYNLMKTNFSGFEERCSAIISN